MCKNIRDYTISEVVELPSSVIENLSDEDKKFYIDVILNKDNTCEDIFSGCSIVLDEKKLNPIQHMIINNIVKYASEENIKDFLIINSSDNNFYYTSVVEMSFYVKEDNKRDFYKKTQNIVFNYELEFDNCSENEKSSQEEFRHEWLKNAFLYLDKNDLVKKWHKEYINIIDNLSHSDFHIKAEMFWFLGIYENEEVYDILLNNKDYHYLMAGDKKSQHFDLQYKNEIMECIMAPQVNKNCIYLIFRHANFSNLSKIKKMINDLEHIKSINKLVGVNKYPFKFSTIFYWNRHNYLENYLEYYQLYNEYIDNKSDILTEFFNTFYNNQINYKYKITPIKDYNSIMEFLYNKIEEKNDSEAMFKLINLWLKHLSITNIDFILKAINKYDLKYKFSKDTDHFLKPEDKVYLKIDHNEDLKNVKLILDKIMPYIKDIEILRRSVYKEFIYLNDKRIEMTNEFFHYFCKTKYKRNIFNHETMENILKNLQPYITAMGEPLDIILDKASKNFSKEEFYVFLKTYENLALKDDEYKDINLDMYKINFEQSMLLEKMENSNISNRIKRI